MPNDLAAPSRYRLIIDNFRDDMSGGDPTWPNPSEGGSACAKDKKKGFWETSPEDEECRYHDDNSSALRPAPVLRV
jgi:hypothetical protein